MAWLKSAMNLLVHFVAPQKASRLVVIARGAAHADLLLTQPGRLLHLIYSSSYSQVQVAEHGLRPRHLQQQLGRTVLDAVRQHFAAMEHMRPSSWDSLRHALVQQ
jgi:hypothetical protein